jgi:hypothetical protein
MGEIEDVHDAENKGQTCGNEKKDRAVGQSAQKLRK